jgi:heme exporter protein CcmD
MEDAGFIIGSYVVTFGAIAVYAGWVLRRSRRVTSRLSDEAKPWT